MQCLRENLLNLRHLKLMIEQALSLETGALYACRDGYYDLPFSHNTSVTHDDGRQPCQ